MPSQKTISNTLTVSTLDEGVTYEIQTSVDSVTIQSNQSQTVLSSAVARFFKKEGDNEKVAYNSPYSVYLRSGNTYTFIRSGTGTMCQMTATIASSHDAIVVYLFNDAYTSTSPESNQYVAKKEIKVVKNGNDGKNAVRIDLSNENDMIACDANGNVRFNRTVSTTVSLYDGASRQTIGEPTVSVNRTLPEGVSATWQSSDGGKKQTMSITFPKGKLLNYESYAFTISLTYYNNTPYSAVFTLTRADASAIYQLLPSTNEIAFGVDANNEWIPSTGINIYCGYSKVTGNGVEPYSGNVKANLSRFSQHDGTAPYNIVYRFLNNDGTATDWALDVLVTNGNPTNIGVGIGTLNIKPSTSYIGIEYAMVDADSIRDVSDSNIIDRETIPIIKSGKKGDDAQYIYAKGSARDADSSITEQIAPVVNINGGTNLVTDGNRGIKLVTIDRQTLSLVERRSYDTYGEAVGVTGATGITDLIAKLNALDNSVFVALVSRDAIGWSSTLISALKDYGLGTLPYTATGRYPFLFVGYKGLGAGNGFTRMHNLGSYTNVVELGVYVANGAFTTHDGQDGENVVRVDLDNEMDSMLYDNNNNPLSGNIVSHAHLYDGVTDKTSDATWSLTASGCTISSSTGSTITVTAVSNRDATVTATATYNGKTYSAVMSIKKIVNQDKYDLDVTPNALTLNTTTGWSVSKTITIKVMRTPAGGGTPTAINPSESQYGLAVSKTVGTLSQFDSTNKQFTLTITQQQATNNDNTVITLHKDGDSSKVYDRETVPFNKSANGADGVGERGKTGRFYYYAGEFDANNNTDTFSVSDIQVPFFSHGTNAVSGLPNCHLFDYDTNGSYTMYRMWQISGGGNWNAGSWNNAPWAVMWNDQKYLITEAVFGNYAHFASAIITGDYLISQYVDALGFGGMSKQLDDNSKYIYVDTNDMFGEDSMYDDLTKFPINESYASSPKEITSTSYSSDPDTSPYTSQFDLKWEGGWYCVDIRYLSAGGDLEFKIATSAGATPIYEDTLQQFYVDDYTYEQGFFMFPCTPESSKYRVYFRKTSSDQTATGEIYWVKIRQAKFVPRLCQDMKSGKIATRNIIAKGELHAESFYYETILGAGNNNVYRIENESIVALAYNSMGSKIILPNPENAKGRIIEIYSGIQDGTNNWFKLGYDAATLSTYFKNAIGSTGNYAKADYSIQWKSSYIKLWCDGESWYVLKDEHTVWVNDSDGYRICLNNKVHV